MDILVHNLSHADLLLGVVVKTGQGSDVLVARPKFSKFHQISKALFDHVMSYSDQIQITTCPLYNRHGETVSECEVPLGFDLRNTPTLACDFSSLRVQADLKESDEVKTTGIHK